MNLLIGLLIALILVHGAVTQRQTRINARQRQMSVARRSQIGMSFISASLCADTDCSTSDVKDSVMSCMSTKFVETWQTCVSDSQYTQCVEPITYFVYMCMLMRIQDDGLIISDEGRECVEDKLTIRTYKCATKEFYKLRYNTSMFNEEQIKKFEQFKIKARRWV